MALITQAISVRASTGAKDGWWSIDQNGNVILDTSPTNAAQFQIEQNGDKLAFRSISKNKYLSRISNSGRNYIQAVKSQIDPFCLFLADPWGDQNSSTSVTHPSIAGLLQADNDHFLQAVLEAGTYFIKPDGKSVNDPINVQTFIAVLSWSDSQS